MLNSIQSSTNNYSTRGYKQSFGMAIRPNAVETALRAAGDDLPKLQETLNLVRQAKDLEHVTIRTDVNDDYFLSASKEDLKPTYMTLKEAVSEAVVIERDRLKSLIRSMAEN